MHKIHLLCLAYTEGYYTSISLDEMQEITLLEQDMQNVISYWEKRKQCINSQLQSIEVTGIGVSELFNRGAVCLLQKRLWEAELFYNDALSSFYSVINVTSHSNTGSNDVSQSFSDDDSDSDDEYADE